MKYLRLSPRSCGDPTSALHRPLATRHAAQGRGALQGSDSAHACEEVEAGTVENLLTYLLGTTLPRCLFLALVLETFGVHATK